MGFVEGIHRHQMVMFPESLDEYIADDNPVRFIDAFIESLDLQSLGFERAVPAETGRPPYKPRGSAEVVCLWLSESDTVEP